MLSYISSSSITNSSVWLSDYSVDKQDQYNMRRSSTRTKKKKKQNSPVEQKKTKTRKNVKEIAMKKEFEALAKLISKDNAVSMIIPMKVEIGVTKTYSFKIPIGYLQKYLFLCVCVCSLLSSLTT